MKRISTCLWFDHQAEEAATYYASIFQRASIGRIARYGKSGAEVSGQRAGSVMSVDFQLEDLSVVGLNGGPLFKFTPAMSFFVSCGDEKEIVDKWQKLSAGGTVRMALDKYPWAERYGWTTDRYGAEWQLIQAPRPEKIVPSLLFVDDLFGKGQEALDFYLSVFPRSKVETMARDEGTKTIMHCAFTLDGQGMALMEGQGKHGYTFSHATSLMVHCKDQAELDHYWEKLSAGGSKEPCGWLRDRWGVSWQVVPTELAAWMADPVKSERVFAAMLKMDSLDIAALKRAAG